MRNLGNVITFKYIFFFVPIKKKVDFEKKISVLFRLEFSQYNNM